MTTTRPDLYAVLGLTPRASQGAIRTAYRSLAHQYHPDKNPNPESHRAMWDLNEAYAVLGDVIKRRLYDTRRDSSTIVRPARLIPATIFSDGRGSVDMKGRSFEMQPGDTLYWRRSIQDCFSGLMGTRWDMPVQVHRLFHAGYESFYAEMFGWSVGKRPICTVMLEGREIVVFDNCFRREWLSRRSYLNGAIVRCVLGAGMGAIAMAILKMTLHQFF